MNMDNKELSNNNLYNKERTWIVANNLYYAFNWEDTKEGNEYWKDVYDRLNRIAKEGF